MGIDYSLIGRFNQVQPGGLTRAIRGGVDLRGQVLQNEAQQFNLQQAPILAERATQKWNQDLANLQAEEQKNIQEAALKEQEIKQKKLEADQKFYLDSANKIGSVLGAVSSNEQIPFAFDYLERLSQAKQISSNAWENIKKTIGQNIPDVEMVNYIGRSTLDFKDQMKQENDRLKAEQAALREQGIQQRFEQAEAGRENRLIKTLSAQNQRAQTGSNAVVETDQGLVLINKRTGKVTPIQGDQGTPIMKSVAQKNLSREAAMGVSIGRALDDNLTELKTKMNAGDFKKNVIEAKTPGSDLNRLVSDAVDLLGKKRSGAALNANEEKLYQNLINNKFDVVFSNKQSFLNQIDRLKSENKYFLDALTGTSSKQVNTTQNPYGLNDQEMEEFNRLGKPK